MVPLLTILTILTILIVNVGHFNIRKPLISSGINLLCQYLLQPYWRLILAKKKVSISNLRSNKMKLP
jgi:hypothetical protein